MAMTQRKSDSLPVQTGATAGKSSLQCSTSPLTLIQLSRNTACIWATTGRSTWKWSVVPTIRILCVAGPLRGDADPAGERDPAVDDEQLSVGPVVQARQVRPVRWAELADLHPGRCHLLHQT